MTELTIYGRGGQGGVTLAKLIASAYFLQDKHVQAFGVYAAERSGAPLQAFVRIDDREITNHNQIREPDHVIVLDRTLIGPHILTGLRPDGWIILNAADGPEAFAEQFAGRNVATVDATRIAVDNGLGTRAVPIVNTTILGAAARIFELNLDDVEAALASVNFGGPNVVSARQAYESVAMRHSNGVMAAAPMAPDKGRVAGILDDVVGGMPTIRTGSWATRKPERQRLTPPCNDGCPAGNDVRGFVEAVGKENYDQALEILLETSPLPATCGRVCPAPCIEACNRSEYDEAINIRELERYAADRGRRPKPTKPRRGEQIAVVGSGPAGLSASYHLARLGYPVTLYEADRELGGVLRTGIPQYRLPRDVLDLEIDYILSHGVEVKTGRFVRRADLLAMSREFAAVFVGTGLQTLRGMKLGERTSEFVTQGIDFLNRARQSQESLDGQRVIVVGGGNTAIDAARTALRLGAAGVRIVYRRTREQMPAIREEIDEALEEGVDLHELVLPLSLRSAESGDGDQRAPILTCQRMKLGPPDESGRPRPVPDESDSAVFDLRCDRVLLALGQSTDVSILPEGSEIRENEVLLGLAGAPIFAGGDFAENEGTVTAAIGSGRKAAWHIHRTIAGEDLFPPPAEPVAGHQDLTMHIFSHKPGEKAELLPALQRRTGFSEVRRGLVERPGHKAAVAEAQRCFSCGVCNSCDRCITHCPEGIVVRDGDGYRFDYSYCKGCGVCASECPRGVIYMAEL
ncbi:MAG: FAD-dependent oxidoreductase [bacterium]|nr:FAD-dependent oxidoreductase [bacterium]